MSTVWSEAARSPIELEEHLRASCRACEIAGPVRLGVRRLARSPVDVRLFLAEPPRGAAGDALLERLSVDAWIDSARRKGTSYSLRLTPEFIDELGTELEHGDAAETGRVRVLEGRTFVVNFLNPNATKPLHLGHLRNVAMGMALAASYEECGAQVARQCYVCDIGRNVCEALAGYERYHADEDPGAAGVRPDQFVGRCYSEYATAASPALPGPEPDDPIAGETTLADDRADELIRAWASGDPATRRLWERVRGWALSGQEDTLRRLGVRWDRVHYESATMPTVAAFTKQGLAQGLFVRGPSEAVSYETGREEHASLKLLREDGFPTEHARVIALFLDEQASSGDVDGWIVVCGEEWGTAGQVELEIARRLGGGDLAAKVEVLTHGMVTASGSKMKSRDGRALLIDDFLDRLEHAPETRAALAEFGHPIEPHAFADLLVRGYFLSRKPSKGIEFRWAEFVDPVHNPAWILARAWCRANRADGPSAAPGDAERYRTAVMQFFQYRQLLERTNEGFQGTPLMKFANGIASWYLECPSDERLDRVVRTILRMCLGSLGIPGRTLAR